MRLLTLAAIIVQVLNPSASSPKAEPSSRAPPPVSVPEVTVTAPKADKVNTFIRAIGHTVGNGQLATWKDPVCPLIVGLTDPDLAYFADHIRAIAKEAGINSGDSSCQPNIFVYFTKQPNKLAKILFREKPTFFDNVQPPAEQLNRPVYWRHGLEAAPADGSTGLILCRDDNCSLSVPHARDSHLLLNAIYHLNLCVVIVDVTKQSGIINSALASYIAIVSLAQVSPDAKVIDDPSVLNIFADRDAGRTPPVDITKWDLTYLKSLYSSRGDMAWAEQGEIYNRFWKAIETTAPQ